MANTTETAYVGPVELAGLIRADLRAAFPGVTFSVRSSKYSGGSSVRATWTDGPTNAEVEAVIGKYAAEGFDGSTDSRTNSGPVELADGRRARISSFVFTHREASPALRARVAAWLDRHPIIGENAYAAERRASRTLTVSKIVAGNLVIQHEGRRY